MIEASSERGMALMMALIFIVILTVVVTGFAYEAQVDATAIALGDDGFEASVAAKSALAEGLSILEADLYNNETIDQEFEGGGGDVFDSLDDLWAHPPDAGRLNEASGQLTISDEFGKINLNALIFEDDGEEMVFEPLEVALRILFAELGFEEDPVDAILDWLDSDDEPRAQGYESSYYESLDNSYSAKNGPMDSIEELLLIPGIPLDAYLGGPPEERGIGRDDDREDEDDAFDRDSEGGIPLPDLLTVHGHPEGKVNVNTAELDVIAALASVLEDPQNPNIDTGRERANEVAEHADEYGPYRSTEELHGFLLPSPQQQQPQPQPNPRDADDESDANPPPPQPEVVPLPELFDVRSSVFRLRGDGSSGAAQVRIEAYVWRATDELASPEEDAEPASMFRILEWRVLQ